MPKPIVTYEECALKDSPNDNKTSLRFAEAISKGTSTDPAAAIKQLKNKEKIAGDYKAIRGVPNAVK